ncbi:uncharacterized protein LOC123313008 [Coccinella septempunctata]|uniref:uncharacterized protein LOC123313008 n=1 Tax=Coccinella septempunctata TaxID=41139 RepID=UPI001D05E51B|nr:uncharacterized protein LOC123313008 [Coccinella septempunctata]
MSKYSEPPLFDNESVDEKELYNTYMTDTDKGSFSSLEFTTDNYSENFETPSESSSSYGRLSKYAHIDGTVLNKTFSDNRLRDIERDNSILMSKILSKSKRPKQYKIYQQPQIKSSFDINRKKAQTKIEYENKILLKKIQGAKPAVKH